jgi:hypothetical protein
MSIRPHPEFFSFAYLCLFYVGIAKVNKLLPDLAKPKLSPSLKHVRPGMGGLSVYVGLNGSNAELQLQGKHFWVLWTKEGKEDLDGMVERYLKKPRRLERMCPICE